MQTDIGCLDRPLTRPPAAVRRRHAVLLSAWTALVLLGGAAVVMAARRLSGPGASGWADILALALLAAALAPLELWRAAAFEALGAVEAFGPMLVADPPRRDRAGAVKLHLRARSHPPLFADAGARAAHRNEVRRAFLASLQGLAPSRLL